MQLYQHKEELEKWECRVVTVSFESQETAVKYLKDTKLTWPVILDEEKKLYTYFGMGKGTFWEIWGYQTWLAYFRELLQGRLPRKSNGDIHQQGGDIILDRNNTVRYVHVGRGPADRPNINTLLQQVHNLSASEGNTD
ncbi:hypothetical protein DGMP_18080 [Desulfomarina profundi]|uniref:Alkyl hydroperoxide reductase subunit C/ Thiol specific antioxidant domain-containing protein n=2 Tax=Desulfomarina profundi TaxID=2772557 RepID=A0A8D5JPB8_9BACT|nr:hypothetical protein DGMP_18080 [Desulfomarina profundi]